LGKIKVLWVPERAKITKQSLYTLHTDMIEERRREIIHSCFFFVFFYIFIIDNLSYSCVFFVGGSYYKKLIFFSWREKIKTKQQHTPRKNFDFILSYR
jgi:hypothetical protein